MGQAGIVLGLECSRLARNNADWHRLLEICALTGTLICDEDGLYDPQDFNDRMLLGMKGQLSEAELHFLRSRLRGGILNKARRGELITPLPIGLTIPLRGRSFSTLTRASDRRWRTCSLRSPRPDQRGPRSRHSPMPVCCSPAATAKAPIKASWTGRPCNTCKC
jgi:hypothetical protein